jgi:hypothetical protein
MSCGCGCNRGERNTCPQDRREYCEQPRCNWAPDKFDYQLSDPRFRVNDGRNNGRRDGQFNGRGFGRFDGDNNFFARPVRWGFNDYGYNYNNFYGGRFFAGYFDPLFGRVNSGGFDQPAPWNDDGDQ